jgi:hypothetical protein
MCIMLLQHVWQLTGVYDTAMASSRIECAATAQPRNVRDAYCRASVGCTLSVTWMLCARMHAAGITC